MINWYIISEIVYPQASLQESLLQRVPRPLFRIHRSTQQPTQHVISSEHRRSTRESLFNSYILELQDKFKPATPSLISLISGESGSAGISEDEVEIIGSRGNKRIKTHVDTKHVPAYPLLEANPSQGLAGSSQMFFTAQTFSQSLRMM